LHVAPPAGGPDFLLTMGGIVCCHARRRFKTRKKEKGERQMRILSALWAAFQAAWMPELFDGLGSPIRMETV